MKIEKMKEAAKPVKEKDKEIRGAKKEIKGKAKAVKEEHNGSLNSSVQSNDSNTSSDNAWIGKARVEYLDMKRKSKIEMSKCMKKKWNRNLQRIKAELRKYLTKSFF